MNTASGDQMIQDLKSRIVFENMSSMVTKCTQPCIKSYEHMYLEPEEEACIQKCYVKSFDFQSNLHQELHNLLQNL